MPELWRGTSTPAASISRETAAIPGIDGASAQEARLRPARRLAREDKEQLMTAASRTSARATGNVAPSYVHYDKFVEPADRIDLSGASLKWYDLARRETPIPSEIRLLPVHILKGVLAAGRCWTGPVGVVILHRLRRWSISSCQHVSQQNDCGMVYEGRPEAAGLSAFSFQAYTEHVLCPGHVCRLHESGWKRFFWSARDQPARQSTCETATGP